MARLSNGPTVHYQPKFLFPQHLNGRLPIKQEIYMHAILKSRPEREKEDRHVMAPCHKNFRPLFYRQWKAFFTSLKEPQFAADTFSSLAEKVTHLYRSYFDSNIRNTPRRIPPTAVVLLDNRASWKSRPPTKREITIYAQRNVESIATSEPW